MDAIFHEELKAFFADHERIAEHLQAANQNLTEKQTLLAAHERNMQKVPGRYDPHPQTLSGWLSHQPGLQRVLYARRGNTVKPA